MAINILLHCPVGRIFVKLQIIYYHYIPIHCVLYQICICYSVSYCVLCWKSNVFPYPLTQQYSFFSFSYLQSKIGSHLANRFFCYCICTTYTIHTNARGREFLKDWKTTYHANQVIHPAFLARPGKNKEIFSPLSMYITTTHPSTFYTASTVHKHRLWCGHPSDYVKFLCWWIWHVRPHCAMCSAILPGLMLA